MLVSQKYRPLVVLINTDSNNTNNNSNNNNTLRTNNEFSLDNVQESTTTYMNFIKDKLVETDGVKRINWIKYLLIDMAVTFGLHLTRKSGTPGFQNTKISEPLFLGAKSSVLSSGTMSHLPISRQKKARTSAVAT